MKDDDEMVAVKDDDRAAIKGRKGFRPGKSGNPRGRPKGSQNQTTLMAMTMLSDQVEKIITTVVRKATEGDDIAMRLCMERLVGKAKGRPIDLELGNLLSAEDLLLAHGRIAKAISDGSITPEEANLLLPFLESVSRCIQLNEYDQRLGNLEQILGTGSDV